MKRLFKYILILAVIYPAAGLDAAEPGQLYTAFETIYNSKPVNKIFTFDSLTIQHKDLTIRFDSGRFVFFPPVTIDTVEHYYGGYYSGTIRTYYCPGLDIERDQMRRFFETDKIDRIYENVTILFGDSLHREIRNHIKPINDTLTEKESQRIDNEFFWFTRKENRYYTYWILHSLIHPDGGQFFSANLSSGGSDRVIYIFNPFEREEVRLLKHYWYWHSGGEFMETVCSYSVHASDTISGDSAGTDIYADINGTARPPIRIFHYDIDGSIDRGGKFDAATEVSFEVIESNSMMLEMFLHPEIKVDSVLDSMGHHLDFLRYVDDANKSRPLYIILNHAYKTGDTTSLNFYYHGKTTQDYSGRFYITAGSNWYPSLYSPDRALYDIVLRTPKAYRCAGTGSLFESKVVGDQLVTRWKVGTPTRNVSFSVGAVKLHEFSEAGLPPIEIYFDHDLHRDIAGNLSQAIKVKGVGLEPSVSEDIINSIKLFTEYFGPYPFGQMRVSECRALHGEAFPGFIHLGVPGWYRADDDGYVSAYRAHEVAHQWWGVSVGYETYRDQWLSEGFAEYCGLLYVQAAFGQDRFIEFLREYRENIFNVRKFMFEDGKESGPIAMGYRTQSTQTPGDYGLIIYEKAAFCLHMLRNMMIDFSTMNEDAFFNMMREFYTTYRGKSASTADFKRLTEKYIGIDMTWFFDQWVYGNNLPTYNFVYRFDRDSTGRYTATCSVHSEGVDENFKMYVPLEIEIDRGRMAYIRVLIEGPEYSFSLPSLPKIPLSLRLNPFESVLARVRQ